MLLKDLHLPHLSSFFGLVRFDNQSEIALPANPVYRAYTKHIEVDFHFIREKVVNKNCCSYYIPTTDHVMIIFTKSLKSSRFQFLKDKLMVYDLPIRRRRDVKPHISNPPNSTNYTNCALKTQMATLFSVGV